MITNEPHKLAGFALHILLDDKNSLRTHLHFDDPIAVREYLITQKFLVDITLIPNKKTPHDSPIIDIFKEELIRLVLSLNIDYHKVNVQIHLHLKIAADTDISFKKQATTKATEETSQAK